MLVLGAKEAKINLANLSIGRERISVTAIRSQGRDDVGGWLAPQPANRLASNREIESLEATLLPDSFIIGAHKTWPPMCR